MIYLYIKTHNITGLKYFGKTIRKNYNTYRGSGTYWLRHIKKHGYDVNTELVGCFDYENISEIAINFSIENNIVESEDWANLEIENGLDGRSPIYSENFIVEVSTQYKNKKDIERDYPGILHCAKNYDILGTITEHMIHSSQKWTLETITEEAKKYHNKSEFTLNAKGCVSAARTLGVWNQVTSHMISKRTPKYNIDEALEEAKKYTSKYVYSIESEMGNWLRSIGLWGEATKHMVNPIKIYDLITEDDIIENFNKCSDKTDFSKKYPTYYNKARELKLL